MQENGTFCGNMAKTMVAGALSFGIVSSPAIKYNTMHNKRVFVNLGEGFQLPSGSQFYGMI